MIAPRTLPDQLLEEIALTLENDSTFYRHYLELASRPPCDARPCINRAADRLGFRGRTGNDWRTDREVLRRYFDDRYDIKRPISATDTLSNAEIPSPWGPKPPPTATNCCTDAAINEELSSKENPVNKTEIITVTTKTLVNGTDVSTMTDAQIYSLIADQEAEINRLTAIKNKPRRLVAEIEKREAGIAALVAYLDSKPE